MATEQDIFNYLDDHLPYMLGSVRHNYRRIIDDKTSIDDRNAAFDAFAVNARNLYLFLTNGDTQNFKASDFVDAYKAKKGLTGQMQLLRAQTLHLDKRRPRSVEDKFNSETAGPVYRWLENQMDNFISRLGDLKKHWNAANAGTPVSQHSDTLSTKVTSTTTIEARLTKLN